jgi:hypothetical protein
LFYPASRPSRPSRPPPRAPRLAPTMPEHHWAAGPGWCRLRSLAAGLAEIAEEGGTAQLLARAESPDAEAWGQGWRADEVIAECAVELRLGPVAGFAEPLTHAWRGALVARKPPKSGNARMGLRGVPSVPHARGAHYKVPCHAVPPRCRATPRSHAALWGVFRRPGRGSARACVLLRSGRWHGLPLLNMPPQ